MRKNYFYLVLAIVFTMNAMAQNIPSYVPTNGLVGYWPFNGNANDESGNGNNGTVNGATLTADRNGKTNSAYNFNGQNNYIKISKSNHPLGEVSITYSAWINSQSLKDVQSIIEVGTAGVVNKRSALLINYATNEKYVTYCGHSNDQSIIATNLLLKNWNHLVITKSNNILNFYINSKFINKIEIKDRGQNIEDSKITFGSNGVQWGYDNGEYFLGQLDDIAIYNRALTEQEITALYTSTPVAQNIPSYVPTNGLVGYWPFNGNANDESGNGNNGTVNGATLTTDRFGVISKAYSFDGVDDQIDIQNSNNLNFTNTFTISIWHNDRTLNFQSVTQGKQGFLVSKVASGTSDGYWFVSQNNNTGPFSCNTPNKTMNVAFYQGGSTSPIQCIDTLTWHNIIFSMQNGNYKTYLNGVLIDSSITTLNNILPNSLPMIFGFVSNPVNNDGRFNGILDDIAIYNRALTEQEITALYSGTTNLASTKVFVDAPASVNQNDTLELSISTETLNSSDNVIAFQTDITYDTTRYTFVSNHTVGTLNPKASVDLNTDKKGTIKVGYISTSALQGAGSLLKLKFKANQQVGQGIFGLSQFMYNNTDITSLKNDTVLTLDVTPPSASISLSQNPVRKGDSLLITVKFSETMIDKPAPQVSLSGANTLASTNLTKVNDTTYTYWWVVEKGNGAVNVEITSAQDLAGNNLVKPTVNTSFTVLPTLFGDIDTNKIIRAYDAALALQYSVGLNPLPTMDPLPWSNWRIAVANVDTVGSITANDAALIVKYSIGKITSFPADAKKRTEDAPIANITVTQEANQLVFRATGTLYAFNVFMKDNFNAFGQPEVKDKNAMIATNITSTTYNVGLASTTPFTENEPFLILPIVTNENVQGTMDIVANAQEKALAYGAAASISNLQNEAMVIYPNPTKDMVTINNAQGKTLRIVDFQGRIVNTQIVTSNAHDVSLKAIATKGEYIFQLIGENNETIVTQKVVMQ